MSGGDRAAAAVACLAVFSKPAIPGRVKTRLIGELTAEQAAELHAAFLGDLVEEMNGGNFDLKLAWALEPGERAPDLGTESMRQIGLDLGERLFGVLRQLAETYRYVAAVGSDHPDLPVSIVDQAFDKLVAGSDVILGPATDGGYYLVAVRATVLHQMLFAGIPWSSGGVLRATLDRCKQLGLEPDLLPSASDVDTPEDLGRLHASLELEVTRRCPRTRELLRTWKRLYDPDTRGVKHENP